MPRLPPRGTAGRAARARILPELCNRAAQAFVIQDRLAARSGRAAETRARAARRPRFIRNHEPAPRITQAETRMPRLTPRQTGGRAARTHILPELCNRAAQAFVIQDRLAARSGRAAETRACATHRPRFIRNHEPPRA